MKLKFNKQEFVLSHWKVMNNCYCRVLYVPSSCCDFIIKHRSVGATNFYINNHYIYISGLDILTISGEGYLSKIAYQFNNIYKDRKYKIKELEIAKMDVTNFILKYTKLYSFT